MNPILISKNSCSNTKTTGSRFSALIIGASLVLLTGLGASCNTTRGFGQDVQKTGDKIEDAAQR